MYDLSCKNVFGSKQQKLRVCYEINRISNFAEIEVQDLQKFKNNICMLEGKLFHFLFDSQEGKDHKFLNLTVTTIVKYCMNKMCKFICISHMVFLGYPYFGCKICQ